MEANIALVVLIGLPGVGKSTLCEHILSAAEKKLLFQDFFFIHVCYDSLIPLSAQEKFAEARKTGADDKTTNWKEARRQINSGVDELISCIKSNSHDNEVFSFLGVQRDCLKKNSKIIILLDDNFYYQSMRYEYYQLARKHTIGFSQVFLNIDVDVAVQLNLNRSHSVPSEVIYNMAQKLQPPRPQENSWESLTMVISSLEGNTFDILLKNIQETLLLPVQPIADDEPEKEEARLICSQNVAHQTDLYLRSLVGKTIKNAKKTSSADIRSFSARVNAARQTVMTSIRSCSLLFPPDFAEVVDNENRQHFEAFLQVEFQKHL